MATASVTNSFVNGTTMVSANITTNFVSDLVAFLNNSIIHRDGSKTMTAALGAGSQRIINVTPATNATDLVGKAYIDSFSDTASYTTRTTPKSIASFGSYDILWETEVVENTDWVTVGSATLTCQKTGLYRISCVTSYSGSVPNVSFNAIVGTPVRAFEQPLFADWYREVYWYMQVNDTFKVTATEAFGSPMSLVSADLSITRMR